MSSKNKGASTCKIVAQNERGMLGQVRDSVYRGVKYCGDGGQVEKMFRFPRKPAEEKWLEWLDADLTEDELRILEPLNRKQRRVAKRANEHNAKIKAELEEERNVEGSWCCAHREGELRGCRDDTSPLKDRQGGSEPLRRKPQAG